MLARRWATVIIACLCMSQVGAAPITLGKGAFLAAGAPMGGNDTVVQFLAPYTLEKNGEVYVVMVPSSSNPAYQNGTTDNGWWWQVFTHKDDVRTFIGAGNGSEPIEVGPRKAGIRNILEFEIRVPAAALTKEITHRIPFGIATRNTTSPESSGGVQDPSIAVLTQVKVGKVLPKPTFTQLPETNDPIDATNNPGEDNQAKNGATPYRLPDQTFIALLIGLIVIVGVLVTQDRLRRRRQE